MKQKNVLIMIIVFSVIFVLSVFVGYLTVTISSPKVIETPTQTPKAVEVIAAADAVQTPSLHKYVIILNGNSLNMVLGDKIIMQTTIIPSMFPSDDIASLKKGRVYSLYEEALLEWESLCG